MASNVAVTYNFVAGTPAVADNVDTNFNDVVSWINTNAVHLDGTKAFTGIPSGPSSDPSTANQLARKAYVDKKLTVCTSGTRPGSPTEGDMIYETDTDRVLVYSGSAWIILHEPPQTWTITAYTQNGSKSCSGTGWYQRSNGVFKAQARITSFAAGSAGNKITLPTPLTLNGTNDIGGSFSYFRSGFYFMAGYLGPDTTTTYSFVAGAYDDAGTLKLPNNSFGITPNFAPASSDVLNVTMTGRYA